MRSRGSASVHAPGTDGEPGALHAPILAALAALAIYTFIAALLLQSALLGDDVVSPGAYFARTGPFPVAVREQAPEGLSLLSDRVNQIMPWMRYAADCLAIDGRLPLWKSLSLCGAPLVGNGQSAHFFPLNLAAILLGAPPWVHAMQSLLKLVGGAFLAFLLARHLRMSFLAALLAGFVFGFGGFQVLYLQHPHTNVSMLLPLLLLATDRVAQSPTAGRIALLALVAGLQHLGGHAETAVHAQLAAGALGVVRAWSLRRAAPPLPPLLGRLVAVGIGLLLGATLGAVQILPQLEYIAQSDALHCRTVIAGFRTSGPPGPIAAFLLALAIACASVWRVVSGRRHLWLSASALAAATFVGLSVGLEAGLSPLYIAPLAADWFGTAHDYYGSVNYVAQNEAFAGAALPLALLGLVAGRPRSAVRCAAALLCLGWLALFTAPGITELLAALPGLKLAVNSRLSLLALLATGVLAGCGLDAIASVRRAERTRFLVLLIVLAGAGYGALVWSVGSGELAMDTLRVSEDSTFAVRALPIAEVVPRMPEPLVSYLAERIAPLNEPYDYFAGSFMGPPGVANADLRYGPSGRLAEVALTAAPPDAEDGHPQEAAGDAVPYLFASAVPRRAFPPGPSRARLSVRLADGETLVSAPFVSPDDPEARSLPFPALPAPGRAPQQLAMLLLATLLCALSLVVHAGARPAVRLALCAALGAALLPFTAGMLPLLPTGSFYPRSDALDTLRNLLRRDERMFATDASVLGPEIPVWYGLRDVRGYDALAPREVARLLRWATDVPPYLSAMELLPRRADFDLRVLGVMATRRIVGWPDAPAPLQETHFEGQRYLPPWAPFRIITNPYYLPRARLVAGAIVEPDEERALAAVTDADFPHATSVVLGSGTPADGGGGPPGTARIVKDRPEIVRVAVEPRGPCHLVLADTFFPGWVALVDGRPREILRANLAFRAVRLDAGERLVEFRYEPFWYRVGGVLSGLTGILLVVAGSGSLLLGRTSAPGPGRRP
jgi:hypothetical protein